MSRYIIDKNLIVVINRGDYLKKTFRFINPAIELPFVIEGDEDLLKLSEGDIILFGLMDPHQHFEHAIIKKEFTKDDFDDKGLFILTLESEDTLELVPGTYYYSIKLLNKEAQISTLVPKTKFIIVD